MKNSLRKTSPDSLCGLILDPLPIRQSTHVNTDSVFSYDNFAVSVNYYVLRPQKKENS
jgi:hypothetical protein